PMWREKASGTVSSGPGTGTEPNISMQATAYSVRSAPAVRCGSAAGVRCGHADHPAPTRRWRGAGWRLRLVSAGHLWSSDIAERALGLFLYFSLLQEPSHVALQPTAIDAERLP